MKDNLAPKNVVRRLKGEMPFFWKIWFKVGMAMAGVPALIIAAAQNYPEYVPEWIKPYLFPLLIAGFVISAMSTMTTKDRI